VGSVVELGRLTETPTPHIDAVYALVSLLAKRLAETRAKLSLTSSDSSATTHTVQRA
jgi:2-dehydropantoate 2-reductase